LRRLSHFTDLTDFTDLEKRFNGFTKFLAMQVLCPDDPLTVDQNSMRDGRNSIEFGSFAFPSFNIRDVVPGQMIVIDSL
jgi:hypothetical protein